MEKNGVSCNFFKYRGGKCILPLKLLFIIKASLVHNKKILSRPSLNLSIAKVGINLEISANELRSIVKGCQVKELKIHGGVEGICKQAHYLNR